jgi:PAT family acetyl-CoA transporter-like MFS transporter 1
MTIIPFSFKLLWAPIVDSLYIAWIGRRKTWIIPCQYLLGALFITASYSLPTIIAGIATGESSLPLLTVILFTLNFLAATQDIAVDGWALTMLSRKNVAYASTCNAMGVSVGFFLGYSLYIMLHWSPYASLRLPFLPAEMGSAKLDGRP